MQVIQDRSKAPASKRVALNMKATPALRERIEQEARAKGLSIAQEVERTILQAYERDDTLGGSAIASFVRTLAGMMAMIQQRTGKAWNEDYATWNAAAEAVMAVLGAGVPERPLQNEADNIIGDLRNLSDGPPASSGNALAPSLLKKSHELAEQAGAIFARWDADKERGREIGAAVAAVFQGKVRT